MYQVELLKAQAEVKGAEIELQNTKMLADKKLCLKTNKQWLLTKLQQAEAEVSLAKLHLSFTEIRAPFLNY
jgi:membrane fusion protein (multidrug efflux system)